MKIIELIVKEGTGDVKIHVNADHIEALIPAHVPGTLSEIRMASGKTLRSPSCIEHILKVIATSSACHETA